MPRQAVYNPTTLRSLKDLKTNCVKPRGFSNSDILNGHKDALWAVGCEYELKEKYPEALYWYKLSADKHYAKAENNIGMLYNYGKGVHTDYALAMEWYLKAAKKYSQDAFSNIGKLLEKGQGISENKYKALEWYSKYHGESFHIRRLKDQGYYLDPNDKDKTNDELIKETEMIIEYEKSDGPAPKRQQMPLIESRLQKLELQANPRLNNSKYKELVENQLKANTEKMNHFESSFQALQKIAENSQTKIASLKQTNQALKYEKNELMNQIQVLLEREKVFEKKIKKRDNEIKSLQQDRQKQYVKNTKQAQDIEALIDINHAMKLEKEDMGHEYQMQRQSIHSLEKQLRAKQDIMDLTAFKINIPGSTIDTVECINGMLKIFESLLQSRNNENELMKQKMELLLDEEKKKNNKLNLQIKLMRQKATNRHRYDAGVIKDDGFSEDAEYDSEDAEYDSEDSTNDINYDTPSDG